VGNIFLLKTAISKQLMLYKYVLKEGLAGLNLRDGMLPIKNYQLNSFH
jgi:hypothetical protein